MYPDDEVPVLTAERVQTFLATAIETGGSAAVGSLDDTMTELAALRLAPGSAVIVSLSNSVRWLRIYLSALLLGLVPLPVASAAPSVRLRRLAQRVSARALVAGRLDADRFGACRMFPVAGAHAVVLPDHEGTARYRVGEALLSTSGTSGSFTACLHRVDSLLRNASRHAEAVNLTANDVVLVNLPLYYSYALVAQVLAAYTRGARVVLSSPPFTPAAYTKAVFEHGVSHSSITPTIARQLIDWGEPLPDQLRVLTVGGDQLSADQVGRLLTARPGGELYVTYGLTEAGPRVATLMAHAEPAARHASVGRPLPEVRTSLRGTVADGHGELVVRSDTVLLRKVGHSDGGLIARHTIATGDLFTIDGDGYHYFHGRLSDFVIIRGEKVSLRTVREAVCAIPGVVQCEAVVGTDDGDKVIDLEVSVHDPRPGTEQLVRRSLNAMLLRGERPRRITIRAVDPATFRK